MLHNSSTRTQIATNVEKILARFDQKSALIWDEKGGLEGSWLWNDAQDTIYATSDRRLDDILHIFHKEWHGIRAAAGSLPGRKLAIPEVNLSTDRLNVLALEIQDRNPSRIIFHGYSSNMGALIKWFHHVGLSEKVYLIFHGSPAQWWNDIERKYVFDMIRLAQNGLIHRVHIMKRGMELPGVRLFSPLLYNISPNHSHAELEIGRSDCVSAFVPGWGNWIKNVFGSALGASLSENVDEVWAFAEGLQLPNPLNEKLLILKPTDRQETFRRYLSSHLTLNVSLIDCHPMVNVESQSLGRPCVRADLNLDAFEDHEYVKIVNVGHNNSPADIRNAVDRTLSVPKLEMKDMLADYQSKIDQISIERYIDFLKI